MSENKKRPVIQRKLDEEMAEIDAELDNALERLDAVNLRVGEVLQTERAAGSIPEETSGQSPDGNVVADTEQSFAETV